MSHQTITNKKEMDYSENLLSNMSISRHNSCVEFSFLAETTNSNTRKLTRLNGLFHYLADRKTGGLRSDKLHDLIISAECSEFTTQRLESFLFPKLKADGIEIHKKEKRLFGNSEKIEVDVRIISRGPFLAIFKDESMRTVNTIMQAAASNKTNKVQWRQTRSEDYTRNSIDENSNNGPLYRTAALKDSRTVKTEPALMSNSNWKNTSGPTEENNISTIQVQNEDSSEIIHTLTVNVSPQISEHDPSYTNPIETLTGKVQRRKKDRSKKREKYRKSKKQQIYQNRGKSQNTNYSNDSCSKNEIISNQRHREHQTSSNDRTVYQESNNVSDYVYTNSDGYVVVHSNMRRNCKQVVENCLKANQHPINMDNKLLRNMLVQQQQHALERRRREENGDLCFFSGFAKFVKTLMMPKNDIIH